MFRGWKPPERSTKGQAYSIVLDVRDNKSRRKKIICNLTHSIARALRQANKNFDEVAH